MPRTIFPRVPVRDVEKTRAFWTQLAHLWETLHMDGAALEEMTHSGQ